MFRVTSRHGSRGSQEATDSGTEGFRKIKCVEDRNEEEAIERELERGEGEHLFLVDSRVAEKIEAFSFVQQYSENGKKGWGQGMLVQCPAGPIFYPNGFSLHFRLFML